MNQDSTRIYDSRTHKTIKKDNRVKHKKHYQTFTEGIMENFSILKRVGANIPTLTWEYLCINMDYNNEIHPNINDIKEELDCTRNIISNTLTHFEKELLIIEISGNRKGRNGRSFMLNPNYVNKGRSEDSGRKIKRWQKLIEETFSNKEF